MFVNLYICNNCNKNIFPIHFEYPGTLIYFEIDINKLEKEEYLDDDYTYQEMATEKYDASSNEELADIQ